MTTPQQQIVDKCRSTFTKAHELYGIDLSHVGIRFDLTGRAAGQACRRGNVYYMRFNRDMLTREAFDHVLNNTVPHEVAHIVCFINRNFGSNHDAGWARVCRALGGSGATRHSEDVVYGKGYTYEYITDRGNKVRMGDRHHNYVQMNRTLTYKKGLGTVSKESQYSIVGYAGKSLATPRTVTPSPTSAPAVQAVNPVVEAARKSYTIGAAPVQPTQTFAAGASKASVSRSIMLAGHTRGQTYEQIITAMMTACRYDRQLARATYKANYEKVGCPAP